VAVESAPPEQETGQHGWNPTEGNDAPYVRFPKTHRVVVDDGTTIAYAVLEPARRRGRRRPTVLFVNGWSCSDVYWADILPALRAAGHRCLIADTRGHGASGLPRAPGRGARNLRADDLSIPRMAADFLQVLDDAGADEAIVAGHSMGVQIALEVYRAAPDRVSGLVLVAGSYENPLRTFYGTPLLEAAFPVGRALMAVAPELIRPIWRTIGYKTSGYYGAKLIQAVGPKATADGLHPYLLHLAAADPAVMVRAVDAMRRHSAADLLRRIDVPVLILAADQDHFTPPRCSREMFERIPTAEIRWFADAGHTLPIEEPDEIVATIEEWSARRIERPAATA